MAKNTSFIKLEGTLDGLTFYKSEGENYVKTKGGVSRERILREPRFKRTRENNKEFGGSAIAGKAVRDAFGSVTKLMADRFLSGRLTGIMRLIVHNGSGSRGQRSIDIVSNRALLQGLEFNRREALKSRFFAPFAPPTLDANRSVTTWTVPDFDTGIFLHAPEGATHFKLVLASGLVSNYEYEPALDSYEPTEPDENAFGRSIFSDPIPLSGMVGSDTTLTVDLDLSSPAAATVSNCVAVGVVFFQEINAELYELADGNAMRLVLVG